MSLPPADKYEGAPGQMWIWTQHSEDTAPGAVGRSVQPESGSEANPSNYIPKIIDTDEIDYKDYAPGGYSDGLDYADPIEDSGQLSDSRQDSRRGSILPASTYQREPHAPVLGESDIAQPLGQDEDIFSGSEDGDELDSLEVDPPASHSNTEPHHNLQSHSPPHAGPRAWFTTRNTKEIRRHDSVEQYINREVPAHLRNVSNAPSPTEFQLVNDNFRFHRGLRALSEDEQIQEFGCVAEMSAKSAIEPTVSRNLQWYAFKEALQTSTGNEDGFDKEQVEEFSRFMEREQDCGCGGKASACPCPAGTCSCTGCAKRAEPGERGCGCGGNSSKCGCLPGRCGCTACGHDEDDESVLMDIGLTPITPTFPSNVKIPGLGRLTTDAEERRISYSEPTASSKSFSIHSSQQEQKTSTTSPPLRNPGCECVCGDTCGCLRGQCNCDIKRAPEPHSEGSYEADRLSNKPLGWLIEKAAEENNVDTYHPTDSKSPTRSGRMSLSRASTTSPLGPPPRMTPMDDSIRRPDTPRPCDDNIRQSIEPEARPPNWYRESTPAHEDRSQTPSPVSRTGDIYMRDATPTYTRQGSMPPPASSTPHLSQSPSRQPRSAPRTLPLTPAHYPGQPVSGPFYHQAPGYEMCGQMQRQPLSTPGYLPQGVVQQPHHSIISSHHSSTHPPPQAAQPTYSISAPPIPTDTLSPAKTRNFTNPSSSFNRRKSVVADSGITKPKSRAVSRKVTAKQTKAPKEKTAAQKKKEEGKVVTAVKKIEGEQKKERAKREAREREEAARQQSDGTPIRRSGRIRERRVVSVGARGRSVGMRDGST